MYKYLDKINSYEDYKNFDEKNIEYLANDIRKFLVRNISKTGGHLASNLGIVELTLATHKAYNFDKDKIIYDVGHQSYVHKILTGRKNDFQSLRKLDGLSGFPKTSESKYDFYNTGHSATSISAAVGMAISREIKNEDYHIVSLIGDASISSGVALEGLNYLTNSKLDVLVILNDNEMSISKNVGAIATVLSNIRISTRYRKFSRNAKSLLGSIPLIGDKTTNIAKSIKDHLKNILVDGEIFNKLGINYFGPIDGHDYFILKQAIKELIKLPGPKLLHVKTVKGKGYKFARENPSLYHGVGPFKINEPIKSSSDSFSKLAGRTIKKIFAKDTNSILIVAAMLDGTGMNTVKSEFPSRVIDVGIEESNAVNIAAGAASQGIKSYVSIYSTFLQRAYDQILHDVCLQNLPVTFLIDRAGIVGQDGETHQGLYDLAYLSHIPNISIYAPKDAHELEKLIIDTHKIMTPIAIRYPKSGVYDIDSLVNNSNINTWEILKDGESITILATGKMVKIALEVSEILSKKDINIRVINSRRIKPLDTALLQHLIKEELIITMEDAVYIGGFSSLVNEYLLDMDYRGHLMRFAFPDEPIMHGKTEDVFEMYEMDALNISKKIESKLDKLR